jgi:SAM-dependent methyltransferase
MYSVADYLWMLSDTARVRAYAGALRGLVRRGDRVLDLGAGFGFFSVLAARAGAARVDSVEMNAAIHLGERIAAANGVAGRIAFHQGDVRGVPLDGPIDVIVSDLRGATPFAGRSLATLIETRRRLLRPGGHLIAARDVVYAAPARHPSAFRNDILAAHDVEGVSLEPVERVAYDAPMRCEVRAEDLLAEGRSWCVLDYATLEMTDHVGQCEWSIEGDVVIEGIALWFESGVGAGFSFSTAPGSNRSVYRQSYLPFRSAVKARAGDAVRVSLATHLVRDDYVWEWKVFVRRAGARVEHLAIHQNSVAEVVIDPAAFPVR